MSFELAISDDNLHEGNEEFYVKISSVTNGRVGNPDIALVIILDDDGRRASGMYIIELGFFFFKKTNWQISG